MADQIHKKFSSKQVVDLLQRYGKKEIEISYIIQILQISRRRFFEILKKYRKDRNNFSIEYERKNTNNKIDGDLEENIMTELGIEKSFIEDNSSPLKSFFCYNNCLIAYSKFLLPFPTFYNIIQ